MLADADASLACWLARHLPAGTGIRFDAPRPLWAEQPPQPQFVDVFLYDVRRDGDGRPGGWADVRDDAGRVVGRQRAPQCYRLRYLLTAWAAATATASAPNGSGGTVAEAEAAGSATALAAAQGDTVMTPSGRPAVSSNRPEVAEHELLGLLLCACAAQDALPAECLRGALAGAGEPALLRCSPADGRSDPGRLWTGFGLPPRAFLDLLLVVPVLPPMDRDLAPPAREIALDLTATGADSAVSAATAPRRRSPAASNTRWERRTITERTATEGTVGPDADASTARER